MSRKPDDYKGRRVRIRHEGSSYAGKVTSAERQYDAHSGIWRTILRVCAPFPGRGDEREVSEDQVEITD